MTREENALKIRHNPYNFEDSKSGSSKVIFIIVTISVLVIFVNFFLNSIKYY